MFKNGCENLCFRSFLKNKTKHFQMRCDLKLKMFFFFLFFKKHNFGQHLLINQFHPKRYGVKVIIALKIMFIFGEIKLENDNNV